MSRHASVLMLKVPLTYDLVLRLGIEVFFITF